MANDWHDLAAQEGQLVAGSFRIDECISPREARALRLHDRAPARFLLIDLDERLQAEFEQEPEEVDHPAVVPIWARGGLEPGLGFLITPEPLGMTLDDVLDDGPLELRRALQTVMALVDALRVIHHSGAVLVNLRPTVIHLVEGWSREQVRIPAGPWGIGPAAGQPLGGYCAPEVAFGEPTPVSDQFSLGVIAYELLTGTPPHNPEAPPGDRTLAPFLPSPGVPDALGPMLERLMSENPDDRYPTLSDVTAELKRLEAELLTEEPSVGHFTPIIPGGRTTLPGQITAPTPLILDDDDENRAPPTDPILGTLLVLLSVFACAMGLSYAIFTMW